VDELPLELPPVRDYRPTGTGKSPLVTVQEWVEVDDPVTGRHLQREVDTMPGSAASSWYFLRYCDPHNATELCAREKSDYWMPVDLYVGGAEHLTGHLVYARMWQKFLRDLGVVRDEEPFAALRHQGMLQGLIYRTPDRRVVPLSQVEERDGGAFQKGTGLPLTVEVGKMSKRGGNVVNPDEVIATYGADALRVYLSFMGPFAADKPWQTSGMEAQFNFLRRFWRMYLDDQDRPRVTEAAPTDEERRLLHKTIRKVTEDIEAMSFNTAVSALHVAVRDLGGCTARSVLEPLVVLISPYAPHLAEELWATALGRAGGIATVPWPSWDAALTTDPLVTIGVQVNGKLRGQVQLLRDQDEESAVAAGRVAVERQLAGKTLVSVIYRPGRILSFIVRDP
jgi:leucyl-tRNA synthetase